MNYDLLPCPFCGGEAHIVGWFEPGDGAWYAAAQCVDCGAEIAQADGAHMPPDGDTVVAESTFARDLRAAMDEVSARWNWRRALTVVKDNATE